MTTGHPSLSWSSKAVPEHLTVTTIRFKVDMVFFSSDAVLFFLLIFSDTFVLSIHRIFSLKSGNHLNLQMRNNSLCFYVFLSAVAFTLDFFCSVFFQQLTHENRPWLKLQFCRCPSGPLITSWMSCCCVLQVILEVEHFWKRSTLSPALFICG